MTMTAKTVADCARGNSAEETALLAALLATKGKVQHDRLWAEFVHRYERLIVSCVVKALRRYGATFLARRSRRSRRRRLARAACART